MTIPQPLSVLMTADTVGGVWNFATELCRAFLPHPVRVVLATMGGPLSPAQRNDVADLPHVTVEESAFKLEWMSDPWDDVARAGQWLLALERQYAPDVVHLNGTLSHGSLPWNAPCLVTGHSDVLSWWNAVKNENVPPSWDRYRTEVRAGLQAADLCTAPTRAMAALLQTHYGPLRRDVAVVPNSRDPTRFRPAPDSEKEPFIFCAGRLWDEAKNISTLAAAAPRLAWPVYVAGEEKAGEGAKMPPTTTNPLRPLGQLGQSEMVNWLCRAAIYAAPARYEPFGLSILEAALSGCALVLGDIPSLREVWGDAPLWVPPDNHDALADALHFLISDDGERLRRAVAAQERAQRYLPERTAQGYLECYAGVVGVGLTRPHVGVLKNSPAHTAH